MALAKKTPSIEEVKTFYNHFVKNKENSDSAKTNGRYVEIHRLIDKEVPGKGFKTALDVGCGVGINTEYLLKYIPEVTGTDLSEERIRIASGRGKANYFQADFSNASVGQYDLVCVFDCLEHILPEDRDKFLGNVYNSFKEFVLVSIPEPNNLKKLREERPNILQIVDECIWDEDLSRFTIINKWTKGIYTYYKLGK